MRPIRAPLAGVFARQDLSRRTLGRVVSASHGRDGAIWKSRAFVAHNQSVNETASELHLHRNTLIYRLNRVKTVSGYDPRQALDLVALIGYLLRASSPVDDARKLDSFDADITNTQGLQLQHHKALPDGRAASLKPPVLMPPSCESVQKDMCDMPPKTDPELKTRAVRAERVVRTASDDRRDRPCRDPLTLCGPEL